MNRILVTGATGFIGSHVIQHLIEQGYTVRAIGRNLDKGLQLSAMGADFRPVDLTDRQSVINVCHDIEGIIHGGALSSPWGKNKDFYQINVTGTSNILEGCEVHGVKRLVYISSPSVMSQHRDQRNLCESDPLPDKFVSPYSRSKKLAEDLVRQNQSASLETVIVRPKAVYGPGDNAIFPRLIAAAKAQRLKIIGNGKTVINLTHVEDVVLALELALTSPKAVGKTYLVTGDEEVRIWDVINEILVTLGYPAVEKKIPVRLAMAVAAFVEILWKCVPFRGEPPITRYAVGILAYDETYDISAAKKDLRFKPGVSIKEGIQSVVASYGKDFPRVPSANKKPPTNQKQLTRVTVFNSGFTESPQYLFEPKRSWAKIEVPALFVLIEHPAHGPILFDTGYSSSFFNGTKDFPYSIYRRITPLFHADGQSAVEQMEKSGINPGEINWIFLSHFDPDHYCGIKDFPNARIVCSWRAWDHVRNKAGIAALMRHVLPDILPEDFSSRLYLLPDFTEENDGELGGEFDFFGDGSVRLFELPGHAVGQIGALVQGVTAEYLLIADAVWNISALSARWPGDLHTLIAANRSLQEQTKNRLLNFSRAHPQVVIVPTHCPATYRKLVQTELRDTIHGDRNPI